MQIGDEVVGMQLLDAKFKTQKKQFFLQCLLATVTVLVVLMLLETVASLAVIAALGASAFIVFAIPKAQSSRPRVILGGYLIGTVIGTLCHGPAQLQWAANPVLNRYAGILCAAVAVGLATFLMTVTNSEHPPAVGIALGLVLGEWHYRTIVVVMLGVVVLCIARWILRSWLKNLV